MGSRFVYIYFMKNEPEGIQKTVPQHIEYWKTSDPKGYMGGPFADRTGGLISFEAEEIETARGLCDKDPFVSGDLIENKWIKGWVVKK